MSMSTPSSWDYRCVPQDPAFSLCWESEHNFSCLCSKHFKHWASSQAFRYLVLTDHLNTSELSFNTEIIGAVSIFFFWRKGPRAELLSLESISWNWPEPPDLAAVKSEPRIKNEKGKFTMVTLYMYWFLLWNMHTLNNHLVQFFTNESITSFYMEGMRILEFLTVAPDQQLVFHCDYLERLLLFTWWRSEFHFLLQLSGFTIWSVCCCELNALCCILFCL